MSAQVLPSACCHSFGRLRDVRFWSIPLSDLPATLTWLETAPDGDRRGLGRPQRGQGGRVPNHSVRITIAAHRCWFSLAFFRCLLTSQCRIGRGVVRSAPHLRGKFTGIVQAPPAWSSSFKGETGTLWADLDDRSGRRTEVEGDGLRFVTSACVHASGSDQYVEDVTLERRSQDSNGVG